nr:hypothetical protein [Larkinella rosea]
MQDMTLFRTGAFHCILKNRFANAFIAVVRPNPDGFDLRPNSDLGGLMPIIVRDAYLLMAIGLKMNLFAGKLIQLMYPLLSELRFLVRSSPI